MFLFGFFSTNANATTVTNTNNLKDQFPAFKKDLAKYSNGNLVTSQESYVRFKLKDEHKNITENRKPNQFTAESFTKEGYEKEIIKEKISKKFGSSLSRSYIGNVDTSQEPYWLRMNLEVYQGNTNNKFRCYSFASWKTKPAFTFTDGHGISTSDAMLINEDPIETQYMYMDSWNNVSFEKPGYIENRYGVVSEVDLVGSSEIMQIVSHNSMIGVTAQFANETPGVMQTGKIFSEYLHKEVALGGIEIDSDGKPAVGIQVSSDSYSLSCQVRNF